MSYDLFRKAPTNIGTFFAILIVVMNRKFAYIIVFALGMIACQDAPMAPSSFVQGGMSFEDRMHHSVYDWEDTREVTLHVSTPEDVAIKLRAVNGEILYHGFHINGVLSHLVLNLPQEIDTIYLEYGHEIETVVIENGEAICGMVNE